MYLGHNTHALKNTGNIQLTFGSGPPFEIAIYTSLLELTHSSYRIFFKTERSCFFALCKSYLDQVGSLPESNVWIASFLQVINCNYMLILFCRDLKYGGRRVFSLVVHTSQDSIPDHILTLFRRGGQKISRHGYRFM